MKMYEIYEDQRGFFHFFVLQNNGAATNCVAALCGIENKSKPLPSALSSCWCEAEFSKSHSTEQYSINAQDLYKFISQNETLVAWLDESEMVIHGCAEPVDK